ncbi:hypothetical protein PLESTB_000277000 [Pleodorina starrii]|uniref:Uncharacterized protein n=1 Tax=Pleodorina starrii TaxID=330485 RepID=A0A9W6BCN0_9CHLO|nr:hypothetical protein PLESTM_001412800 [Pleodorina starrii]GLC49697.1 hypothetical protein PLESTB_000277000 [Pleodorina starrii]GLC77380.1 hypothetical protein PLESTF_001927500 [Pleodorina starrii]GLC77381.1 hypothetical protein PLESTF_001927600 [Pleodorina starrii]
MLRLSPAVEAQLRSLIMPPSTNDLLKAALSKAAANAGPSEASAQLKRAPTVKQEGKLSSFGLLEGSDIFQRRSVAQMNRAFQRGQAHEAKLREVLRQEAKIVPGGLRALMRDLTGVPLPKFAHYYETLDKWKNLSKGIYANTAAELVYKYSMDAKNVIKLNRDEGNQLLETTRRAVALNTHEVPDVGDAPDTDDEDAGDDEAKPTPKAPPGKVPVKVRSREGGIVIYSDDEEGTAATTNPTPRRKPMRKMDYNDDDDSTIAPVKVSATAATGQKRRVGRPRSKTINSDDEDVGRALAAPPKRSRKAEVNDEDADAISDEEDDKPIKKRLLQPTCKAPRRCA